MKKQIENRIVALDALTPHKRNYNRHGDAQIADLRESLRQFGQVRSVVVQADKAGKRFTIVAGHGIAQAAQAEGYTELRADVIPHSWSETRVLAYLAADNELGKHADPDADQLAAIVRDVMAAEGEALARLAAGEQAALDAILNAGSVTEETVDAGELVDKAAELQKKWQVQRGDVWEIGRHRLMCGDSTSAEDVKTLMQGELANLVFTDPPYGVDYEGGLNKNKREKLQGDDSGALYFIAMDNCARFSEKSAPVYLWFAASVGKPVYDSVYASGYKVRAMIIWNKVNAHYGNFMAQYMQKHEPCLYLVRDAPKWIGATNEVTVWDVKQPSVNEHHPTQKPVELATRAIGNHDALIVADWFSGSGTTLVACEQTGRIGRGMEIEPKYCAVTLERMSLLGLASKRLTDGQRISANSEKSAQNGRQTRKKSRVARELETVS